MDWRGIWRVFSARCAQRPWVNITAASSEITRYSVERIITGTMFIDSKVSCISEDFHNLAYRVAYRVIIILSSLLYYFLIFFPQYFWHKMLSMWPSSQCKSLDSESRKWHISSCLLRLLLLQKAAFNRRGVRLDGESGSLSPSLRHNAAKSTAHVRQRSFWFFLGCVIIRFWLFYTCNTNWKGH